MILQEDGSWSGGLLFNKSELIECSLVGIPANPDALAKSIEQNIGFAREVLDYALDNWARGTDGKAIERAAFEEMYRIIGRDEQPAVEIDNARRDGCGGRRIGGLREGSSAAKNLLIVSRDRSDKIERAARNQTPAEKRRAISR
jgi:hypothetical protein